MATTNLIAELDELWKIGRKASEDLEALRVELQAAVDDLAKPRGQRKVVNTAKRERTLTSLKQDIKLLDDGLKRAQNHMDTFSTNWAKKALKTTFQPKVAQNRKDLKNLWDAVDGTRKQAQYGCDAADFLIFTLKTS
jgi:hypothetical protein